MHGKRLNVIYTLCFSQYMNNMKCGVFVVTIFSTDEGTTSYWNSGIPRSIECCYVTLGRVTGTPL